MSILNANGSIACAKCGDNARAERDQLKAENAKLRKLVYHMHECMSNVDADGNHECFSCEYENADCEFDRRIRELGIEVGDD